MCTLVLIVHGLFADRPEDCYVDMQPGLDPFANDKPEPIYIEMNSQEFVRAPPEKLESLYYATKDLFLNRKDLQVQVYIVCVHSVLVYSNYCLY